MEYYDKYNLLIVESPTKASTIAGYLKEDHDEWIVRSTKGHIFNLPSKEMGLSYHDGRVDAKWTYASKDTKKILTELKQLANNAESVFIATDDDREGERIASDLAKVLKVEHYERVVFKEITKKSVIEELYSSLRDIDAGIVSAATATRFIDRELGYRISEVLRRSVGKTIHLEPGFKPKGVGRVISPALALICERERQINAFVSQRYYQVVVDYVYNGRSFRVHNPSKFTQEDELVINKFISKLQTSEHVVTGYDEKIEDVSPLKPLHTSQMQYSAWYILGIMPEDSMKLAQKLFELGLITYHRTDSLRMSDHAVKALRNTISVLFSGEYLSPTKREYGKKDDKEEGVQDAHEAIRPTGFTPENYPENVKKRIKLSTDEYRLYELIWARTLVTQMADAQYDRSVIEVTIGDEVFKARANERVFDGWEIVSEKILGLSKEKKGDSWKDEVVRIPKLSIGEKLYPLEIFSTQHDTRRPPRYGVGTFISTIHSMGFARPSTIGTVISRLQEKGYIKVVKGVLMPTSELGVPVDEWTSAHFPWLNDVKHAKVFEEELEKIERGEIEMADSLVYEYRDKIIEKAKEIGVDISDLDSNAPSEAQVEFAKKLAVKHGIHIGEETLKDKKKLSVFISNYSDIKKVKRCPYCKDGDITEGDSFFRCDNKGCNFIITKKRILQFFERFRCDIEEYMLNDMVKKMSTKEGYFAEGLISKEGKEFSTKLVFDYNEQYGWGISFVKKGKRKE